ncbi:2Fe-2S iron-sulfur cluster-binding protein [Mariniblastus fucicola]|uniref:nitric oxide dioxygenase n=1 Tax=Mariniblastus fucicola TaxID=980251 RepID=A0A5B9PPC3_9BACT|nr:2Fe-2S iron-sulfur cluster-binding protein [Mariniblastus fucicola]QEG24113.1 Flavohemoprotein [Mariniblastus fucicola]
MSQHGLGTTFMFGIDSIILFLGIGLCAAALLGVASWAGQTLMSLTGTNQAHQESTRWMREAIRLRASNKSVKSNAGAWNGYRDFIVTKMVRECVNTVSVYLAPEDGKPIPGFKPGQHITLKFQPKGKSKPLIRCYSLSGAPGNPYYRVTVKHVADRGGDKGPGVVSTIVNFGTRVGHRIPIKAPSGHFYLDEQSDDVAVLLAGGIGITPMVSMLDHLLATNPNRSVVLIHGVRNSEEQQFKEYLGEKAAENANVHVINCYSRPQPDDIKGVDYQVQGFVSIDLLKAIIPGENCQFYLCGPPAFMESLHSGLEEWGIDASRIKYEQFGPSTIKKSTAGNETKHDSPDPVSFLESNEVALWNSSFESLLELAEANDIPIESGCRAGSCGTCETAIVSGKVRYTTGDKVSCNPGCCLPCIAVPDGALELEV